MPYGLVVPPPMFLFCLSERVHPGGLKEKKKERLGVKNMIFTLIIQFSPKTPLYYKFNFHNIQTIIKIKPLNNNQYQIP